MAGGRGDTQQLSRKEERRRGHRQKPARLPLDIIIDEIAARSDAATLVRCAATCRDARRRIAGDPDLGGRLRLRDTELFVLPLLRGHLTGIKGYTGAFKETTDLFMEDTTGTAAADATSLLKATFSVADERLLQLVDSRGGLVLVSATTTTTTAQNNTQLLVGNLAGRRCHALPPEPALLDLDAVESTDYAWYVLLAGGSDDGGAIGRRFQVLKAKLVMSDKYPSLRRLLVRTFSSEHGAWSPRMEIPTPDLEGGGFYDLSVRPLVVDGDVVHWLYLTDRGSYMLVLHVGAARADVTSLPASFPRDARYGERHHYLLATATAGGNPVVLVADADKISAWEQSKHTKMWEEQPQVVIDNETMLRSFKDDGLTKGNKHVVPWLLWFGERSGAVFLQIRGRRLLWLDLHSKKIIRCFSDRWAKLAQVYCPYEVHLSSWVPTFSSVVTL